MLEEEGTGKEPGLIPEISVCQMPTWYVLAAAGSYTYCRDAVSITGMPWTSRKVAAQEPATNCALVRHSLVLVHQTWQGSVISIASDLG